MAKSTFWLGFSGLSAYGAFYQYRRYQSSLTKFAEIDKKLSEYKPISIQDKNALNFPWNNLGQLDKWEYELVKLIGFFKEERFFVRREKDGKPGYMVFAPFITTVKDLDPQRKTAVHVPYERGIMVNLGWVPLEHQSEIEMNAEPLPALEPPGDDVPPIKNAWTGLVNHPKYPNQDEVKSLTEVTGILRKGESSNPLLGHVNFPADGNFGFVDLQFMANLHRLQNYSQATTFYLERVVATPEEADENTFPIPATKDTFFKPYITSDRHKTYSQLFGALSLGGYLVAGFKLI